MAEDEASLDRLMARLAEGERDAFDPLFHALVPRAERLARARLGADLADDVVQNALLKVFARAHEFVPGRSALAWFYGIVGNEIRAAQRKARPGTALDLDVLPSGVPNQENLTLERELMLALEAAIEELDAEASEAIHALLGRGPKPNLEAATLRKRISRAYARLRVLLGVT